ncbi:MAG: GIY-YIG nuclease family protein [Peptoniphilaceae bacterium]|nr:GIY-YIG nuclease family protein [Peptoniphilaceae bacterium]MCI6659895.1 GIY-YIG nuclease family protein [Peptoniphilaceae bacterium]MDD7434630.1 GIY-YIG nuclease family protein [Peptoniphilaceae bacterium]MDY3075155.1 GIY-YIG nuclease family protein [Peptoniphilaceae bacterium]MDY3987569.1 GIY-YIG nuclease family protein [Peptoniphilaceae bacterium]
MKSFYVYIVECVDHTLYTGYAADVFARVKKHNEGLGAKYTRARRPVSCRIYWKCESKSEALRLEARIKRLTRQAKLKLIATSQFPLPNSLE